MRTKNFIIAFVVISLGMIYFLHHASAECCITYGCSDSLKKHIPLKVCPKDYRYVCEYDLWKRECPSVGCIQGMNCNVVELNCTLYNGPPVRIGGICDGTKITNNYIYYVACQDCICDDIFNCFFCPDGGIPEEETHELPCTSAIWN